MQNLKKLIAKILEISENDITDDTSPETIGSWDSFNGLMMVSELENAYNIKFSMDEVVSVRSFKDIKAALGRHSVKLE
ncbi:MAG: acyl carrier protein [Candidatus Falkowbacteria bacterium]